MMRIHLKKRDIFILSAIYLIVVCLIIWSNNASKDQKVIDTESVSIPDKFNPEYLNLFNQNAQKKLTAKFSFICKIRNPFCNADYDSMYRVIVYKIGSLKNFAISQKQGDVGEAGVFLNDNQKYFSLNISAKKLLPISNVYLITENFKTETLFKDDTFAYYYLPNGGFSVTYGPSNILDFYIEPYESVFAKDKLPKSILFIKQRNNLYFLMMFPIHKGNQLPKNLLLSLIKKT
jgi:hypothetical protein